MGNLCNILVTGGAGYVGSHIAIEMLDAGYPVLVVDNLSTGNEFLVPRQAEFQAIDIRDVDAMVTLMRSQRIGAVVHCAGSTVVPESVQDPLNYYDNNVAGSLALFEAMQLADVRRLVFSSTAAVYDVRAEEKTDEASALGPCSPYGASKLMVERIIQDLAAAYQLDYMILRYFNVAGADAHGRSGQCTPGATHLIKIACEVALGKRHHLDIYGTDWPTKDGTGVRDFIHVSDLAEAHRLAMEALLSGGGNAIYNCGYGYGYSVKQVVRALEDVVGYAVEYRSAPRRPGDLASVVADSRALKTDLRWVPRYDDIREILSHALAWERRL